MRVTRATRTPKITHLERCNLELPGNLSDAQVYWPLEASQATVLAQLSPFTLNRTTVDVFEEKSRFAAAFAAFHRGLELPHAEELMFAYSASNAMEIVLNQLRIDGASKIQLLHPTFDATFHAAKRHCQKVIPLDETEAFTGEVTWAADGAPDALILTLPNNPTGRSISAHAFARLCEACAGHGVRLVLDCCFRAYEHELIDHYAVIRRTGVVAAVIEDTGKLFNVMDLKLGVLWATPQWRTAVAEVHKDFILEAPLFHLTVLRHLLAADVDYPIELRARIAKNREQANNLIRTRGLAAIGGNHSAVQLYRVPYGQSASLLAKTARSLGVGLVEADGFFWAAHPSDAFIRIALARPCNSFNLLLAALVRAIDELQWNR